VAPGAIEAVVVGTVTALQTGGHFRQNTRGGHVGLHVAMALDTLPLGANIVVFVREDDVLAVGRSGVGDLLAVHVFRAWAAVLFVALGADVVSGAVQLGDFRGLDDRRMTGVAAHAFSCQVCQVWEPAGA
jgi:hypothetical protein